jgi:hypothetical protein
MKEKKLYSAQVAKEDNILDDLNTIVDFCIGNERPTDVGFNERNTLPEILSYAMIYPKNKSAVEAASKKVKELTNMVGLLQKKINMMQYRNQLREPKNYR